LKIIVLGHLSFQRHDPQLDNAAQKCYLSVQARTKRPQTSF